MLLSTDEPPRLRNGLIGFEMQHVDGHHVTVRIDGHALLLALEADDAPASLEDNALRRRMEGIARLKFARGDLEVDGGILIRVPDLESW